MKKIWLDINTGNFIEHHEFITQDDIDKLTGMGLKLIEYKCVNDEKFEFYNDMRIVSNTNKPN